MSLQTPDKVRKLQRALHAKAKGSPDYRFYTLYDKVCRKDVLAFAYRCSRANGGAPGVDSQTFADIEAYGADRWLSELAVQLESKSYRAQSIRREYIPKPDGSQRPLGIPTIRDRVVQTAAVLVLELIFEADLQPEQYAYRRHRSALDAVSTVHALVNSGHTEVVDADLSGYFDSIPHAELMKSVARRVSDGCLLRLIKQWLTAPVEDDVRGKAVRTTCAKDTGRGTPQGAPISPLMANLYMRRFILGWKVQGYEQRLDAHIVDFADDLVICCRGSAEEAMTVMQVMMKKLKLTVNEAKTQICIIPRDAVDFLGYTIGRCYSPKTGRAYVGTRPSKKAIRKVCLQISEHTDNRWLFTDVESRVAHLNRLLIGWSNYFCLGRVSRAYRAVDSHTRYRLRQWLRRKHQEPGGRGIARYPHQYLHQTLGLTRLVERTRSFPWANA